MESPLVSRRAMAPATGFAQEEEEEEERKKRYRVIRDLSGQERILVPVPHFEWVDIDEEGQLYTGKEWEATILWCGERRTLPQVVRDDPDLADEVAGFERAQDIIEKERASMLEELHLYGAIRLPADYLKRAAVRYYSADYLRRVAGGEEEPARQPHGTLHEEKKPKPAPSTLSHN